MPSNGKRSTVGCYEIKCADTRPDPPRGGRHGATDRSWKAEISSRDATPCRVLCKSRERSSMRVRVRRVHIVLFAKELRRVFDSSALRYARLSHATWALSVYRRWSQPKNPVLCTPHGTVPYLCVVRPVLSC